MVKLIRQGVYYTEEGRIVKEAQAFMTSDKKEKAVKRTLAYKILHAHGSPAGGTFRLKCDAFAADGAAYAAADAPQLPVPLTVMGGEDACARPAELAAARAGGGEYVPSQLAGMHGYLCERVAKAGSVIFCTERVRCGALGALVFTAENALSAELDLGAPRMIAVYLRGALRRGVGPTDVALALIKAMAKRSFAAGAILEFIGPGAARLTINERAGVDAAVAACGCLSTVWETDDRTREYFREHGRAGDYAEFRPARPAYYDAAVTVDLSRVEPMLAPLSAPAEAVPLADVLSGAASFPALAGSGAAEGGGNARALRAEIAGGYGEIAEAAEILRGRAVGALFSLRVRPATASVARGLAENGYLSALLDAGASVGEIGPRTLGGGAAGLLFGEGEAFIMDARSVAATALRGGELASALGLGYTKRLKKYKFAAACYESCAGRAAQPVAEQPQGSAPARGE